MLSEDPTIYPAKLITGYFGNLTREAVKRFQAKHGIDPLGIVGPKTRAKLNELSGNASLSQTPTVPTTPAITGTLTGPFAFGYQNEQVKLLQQYLSRDPSIYTGPITGYYGPLTKADVIKFQKKYGIEQTGVAGPKTRAKLNELYGR